MQNNFTINLDHTPGNLENYEIEDKNFLNLRIQLPSGEIVSNNNYKIQMSLSKEAMLALGINLIRAAHQNKREIWHIRPAKSEEIVQDIGVYLHPESCELIVTKEDMGTLDSLLNGSK